MKVIVILQSNRF